MPPKKPVIDYGDRGRIEYNEACQRYSDSLQQIAFQLALQEQAEAVSPRHVSDAHAAITRVGVQKGSILERPETYQALGAFLFGLACAGPDVCNTVLPDSVAKPISVIAFYVFLILGAFLFFFGMYLNRSGVNHLSKGFAVGVGVFLVFLLAGELFAAVVTPPLEK